MDLLFLRRLRLRIFWKKLTVKTGGEYSGVFSGSLVVLGSAVRMDLKRGIEVLSSPPSDSAPAAEFAGWFGPSDVGMVLGSVDCGGVLWSFVLLPGPVSGWIPSRWTVPCDAG